MDFINYLNQALVAAAESKAAEKSIADPEVNNAHSADAEQGKAADSNSALKNLIGALHSEMSLANNHLDSNYAKRLKNAIDLLEEGY